jgi:hypothetical protein
MRELLRVGLRFVMILFLVVSCVQNLYYMGELTKHEDYGYSRNKPIIYHDEEEDDEYANYTNVDTTSTTTETAEVTYPEYNRRVRAVRPY